MGTRKGKVANYNMTTNIETKSGVQLP